MGFSRILAEFAEKIWLAENPPEKNTASRKSAEKVGQPAECNKKIRLVGLCRATYVARSLSFTIAHYRSAAVVEILLAILTLLTLLTSGQRPPGQLNKLIRTEP